MKASTFPTDIHIALATLMIPASPADKMASL